MSNYNIPIATGINYYLQNLQNRWYRYGSSLWGLNDTTWNSFGMAVRNQTKDGYIPEYWDANQTPARYVSSAGSNNQGGLFFDDSATVVSFFSLIDNMRDSMGMSTAKLRWYFFITDVTKMTPGGMSTVLGMRPDEIIMNDVKNFIQGNGCQFRARDSIRDIDHILDKYSGDIKRNVMNRDMMPKFCFTQELELNYNPLLYMQSQPVKMPRNYPISLTMFIVADPSRDASNPGNLIAVGAGKFVWKYYAPGDTLTPLSTTGGNGYAAGLDYLGNSFLYNGSADDTPTYSKLTGTWDRSGSQGGFNVNDIVSWTIIDYQKI